MLPLPLPEIVEDVTEALLVQVQAENILLVGVHQLSQAGVRKLGESFSRGLEHLTANI